MKFIRYKSCHSRNIHTELEIYIFFVSVLTEYQVSSYKLVITSLLGVLLYAMSDEFHQLFVDGRSARVFDIMVDFFGGTIGILLFKIVSYVKEKKGQFN